MINTVIKASHRHLYLSHLAWGVVFIILLTGFIALWQSHDRLKQQLADTKQELKERSLVGDCMARDTWQKGTTRVFQLNSSGWERTYRVHLPSNFTPDKKYPVLLAFAGKGEQAKEFQLTRELDTLPAITIYPQPTIGLDGTTAWQGASYSSGANDITFVNDLLDKIEGQLCIQKSRIYSVGWSNGGNFSWLLSCRSSDRIAAFAMIAGAFYYPEKDCHAKQPAAIINIHGDKDRMVPYNGSSARKLPSIDSWMTKRAESNACNIQPTTVQPDLFTEVTTWQHCKNNATIQNVRLLGGAHAWPAAISIPAANQHTALQKTPDALWYFFKQHAMH